MKIQTTQQLHDAILAQQKHRSWWMSPEVKSARDNPSKPITEGFYCIQLNKTFRSEFEANLAKLIVGPWRLKMQYEPHILEFQDGTIYIPDFFLPDYTVWIEAKGLWRLGAKKKVEQFISIVGASRCLLVMYDQIKNSLAKDLRKWGI